MKVDMEQIVELVKAKGFAAYVEQTGGGTATIYASREWEQRKVTYLGMQPRLVDFPKSRRGRCELAAGPGWFEPGWPGGHAYAENGDFYVGPDDRGEAQATTMAGLNEAGIASFIADRLRRIAK